MGTDTQSGPCPKELSAAGGRMYYEISAKSSLLHPQQMKLVSARCPANLQDFPFLKLAGIAACLSSLKMTY